MLSSDYMMLKSSAFGSTLFVLKITAPFFRFVNTPIIVLANSIFGFVTVVICSAHNVLPLRYYIISILLDYVKLIG